MYDQCYSHNMSTHVHTCLSELLTAHNNIVPNDGAAHYNIAPNDESVLSTTTTLSSRSRLGTDNSPHLSLPPVSLTKAPVNIKAIPCISPNKAFVIRSARHVLLLMGLPGQGEGKMYCLAIHPRNKSRR